MIGLVVGGAECGVAEAARRDRNVFQEIRIAVRPSTNEGHIHTRCLEGAIEDAVLCCGAKRCSGQAVHVKFQCGGPVGLQDVREGQCDASSIGRAEADAVVAALHGDRAEGLRDCVIKEIGGGAAKAGVVHIDLAGAHADGRRGGKSAVRRICGAAGGVAKRDTQPRVLKI